VRHEQHSSDRVVVIPVPSLDDDLLSANRPAS
jgi:hypothetical protein